MPSQQQTAAPGLDLYESLDQVLATPSLYPCHHLIRIAWKQLRLTSVLCINHLPTVYVHRRDEVIAPAEAAELHKRFWNQGFASLLVVIGPRICHVYSAQTRPSDPAKIESFDEQPAVVEQLESANFAIWFERLRVQLETGAYYRTHEDKFRKHEVVDQALLRNLAHTRDKLASGKNPLSLSEAHSFLGRILFTCYLVDRDIVSFPEYLKCDESNLSDWLENRSATDAIAGLYDEFFPELRKRLNGSMFDDTLGEEKRRLRPRHIELLKDFLAGTEMKSGQGVLGFWAYDFQMIPVETISGIYEDFLKAENDEEKHKTGAYYTPRLLAEVTLDVMLENAPDSPLEKRFLDPSCGSGIFLVLLFNRLAAEWRCRNPVASEDYGAKAEALQAIFQNNLRGIDKNPTACRIACFSLYLAYLDQFDPPSIRHHSETTGRLLPNLIAGQHAAQPRGPRQLIPVIREADFLDRADAGEARFDYILGNPPWAGRGLSVERRFMLAAPSHLTTGGSGCFLLPSKLLLNGYSNGFQREWFAQVRIGKVVMLADYRHLLFDEAECPCMIVRYRTADDADDPEESPIEYVTPKVYGLEPRKGCLPVSPDDRKWLTRDSLETALQSDLAPAFWKSRFWGKPWDWKLLQSLESFPRLNEYVDLLSETRGQRTKRWAAANGFKPWHLKSNNPDRKLRDLKPWTLDDDFVSPTLIGKSFFLPKPMTSTLGDRLHSAGGSMKKLYSKPHDSLFEPPLAVFNDGFSRFAFFDYAVRFQDSLQAISGGAEDEDALLFLTAYLKSKLAYYHVFHVTSNIGTERTKAHLKEVLSLPFFLPDHESAPAHAASVMEDVSEKMRSLKGRVEAKYAELFPPEADELNLSPTTEKERYREWSRFADRETDSLMEKHINPQIYRYFELTEQEIVLVEDTSNILRPCITPGRSDTRTGIRCDVDKVRLVDYAEFLARTLRGWMLPGTPVRVNAICRLHESLGLAGVELIQSPEPAEVRFESMSDEEALAYLDLEATAADERGGLRYLRAIRYFEGERIRIYKPARLGFWMRSTAVNDASALHAEIVHEEGLG